MPEYIAVKRAREKAPSWVKTALENCPTVNQSVKRSA
jgi:hypothetical protein